jgi:hypothetical protein
LQADALDVLTMVGHIAAVVAMDAVVAVGFNRAFALMMLCQAIATQRSQN